FARGLHPAILTDEGLDAALAALARRSRLPVEIISVPDDRLPEPVERAAYFLTAEALVNAAKHASASRIQVEVRCCVGHTLVLIDDAGRGGAVAVAGGGLAGLRDRIEAIGGNLSVTSRRGAGTHIRAEFPCA